MSCISCRAIPCRRLGRRLHVCHCYREVCRVKLSVACGMHLQRRSNGWVSDHVTQCHRVGKYFLHMTYDHEEPRHRCANILWAQGADVPLSEHLQERLATLSDDFGAHHPVNRIERGLPPLGKTIIKDTPTCVRCCSDLERRAVNMKPAPNKKHVLKVVEAQHCVLQI